MAPTLRRYEIELPAAPMGRQRRRALVSPPDKRPPASSAAGRTARGDGHAQRDSQPSRHILGPHPLIAASGCGIAGALNPADLSHHDTSTAARRDDRRMHRRRPHRPERQWLPCLAAFTAPGQAAEINQPGYCAHRTAAAALTPKPQPEARLKPLTPPLGRHSPVLGRRRPTRPRSGL